MWWVVRGGTQVGGTGVEASQVGHVLSMRVCLHSIWHCKALVITSSMLGYVQHVTANLLACLPVLYIHRCSGCLQPRAPRRWRRLLQPSGPCSSCRDTMWTSQVCRCVHGQVALCLVHGIRRCIPMRQTQAPSHDDHDANVHERWVALVVMMP
jgi:hypothetical protein